MSIKLKSPGELFDFLKENAKAKGYLFSKDEPFVNELINGLFENVKRYGYSSCPCRFSTGEYEKDEDIICPCVYMESDVEKYGACYCALYVSKGIYEGKKQLSSIPESRPKEKMFAKINKAEASVKDSAGEKVWKCAICGYEHMGDEPPEKCPKCGASKAMFSEK